MDNLQIAILTKVNELAERNGFSATDFVATLREDQEGNAILAFETSPDASKDRGNRFSTMLSSIGVPETGTLVGDYRDIYSALMRAIANAPNLRIRR